MSPAADQGITWGPGVPSGCPCLSLAVSDPEGGMRWVNTLSTARRGVPAGCPARASLAAGPGSPMDGQAGGERVRGRSCGSHATKDSEGHGPQAGGTARRTRCQLCSASAHQDPPSREDVAPEGSSRALWRWCSALQGHPSPALIHSCPSTPRGCIGQQAMSADTPRLRETEAEEGPGPRSRSRRHPRGPILGTGPPPRHPCAHQSPSSSA